ELGFHADVTGDLHRACSHSRTCSFPANEEGARLGFRGQCQLRLGWETALARLPTARYAGRRRADGARAVECRRQGVAIAGRGGRGGVRIGLRRFFPIFLRRAWERTCVRRTASGQLQQQARENRDACATVDHLRDSSRIRATAVPKSNHTEVSRVVARGPTSSIERAGEEIPPSGSMTAG